MTEQANNGIDWRLGLPVACLLVLLPADLLVVWLAKAQVLPGHYSASEVATMLSAAQLWVIGVLALIKSASAAKAQRYGWLGLGAFFFFLAVDELAEVHEYLSARLALALGLPDKTIAEILVLLGYASIAALTPIRRLRHKLFRDPFSRFACICGAVLLALWLISNSVPQTLINLPETGLKLVGFSLILIVGMRLLALNIRSP